MEKQDLKRVLQKLGAARLSNLIGEERLNSICSIMQDKVTENQLAQIVFTRYGTQIFGDKKVRGEILTVLPKTALSYLAHGNENGEINKQILVSLEKAGWARGNDFTKRFLDLFGVGEEYLPAIKPPPVPSQEIVTPDSMLYPYQKRVKDRFIRALLSNTKRLLLHMPTGAGKTRTATEGLVDFWRAQGDLQGFMIWLTDSEELCTQAEETFTKLWKMRGDRPINLVRLWGAHKIDNLYHEGGLIIASLQKLHRMRTSNSNDDFKAINEINARSRLVVVDEAHKSIAPTYKATIEFLCDNNKTNLVGLTATPGRTDEGQVADLVEFYGNHKITITDEDGNDVPDPIGYLQENEYLSKITRKRVPTDITIDLSPAERQSISEFFEIPPRILLELSKNDQRNAVIVKEIAKLHEQGHQTIVFGCSVEHSHLLTELLMIRGIPARCVDGTTSTFDRAQYISAFKSGEIKVLINYGVLTTGFDAPNTDAVVITRPTGSLVLYSQMIGRGIRGPKMGGTTECILIDLEDNLVGYPSEGQAFKFFDSHWRAA